jgi:hypothetical protein
MGTPSSGKAESAKSKELAIARAAFGAPKKDPRSPPLKWGNYAIVGVQYILYHTLSIPRRT